MTTPTPTAADKRAAEEIVCYHVEWDRIEGRDIARAEVSQLIATAMQPEREALRLAKEALNGHHPSTCDMIEDRIYPCNCGQSERESKALTAIEKATK